MTTVDCFMEADNVYRTKNYIVCQKVSLCVNAKGGKLLLSEDIYLLRNYIRDVEYELIYKVRGKKINGKRVCSGIYTRQYID